MTFMGRSVPRRVLISLGPGLICACSHSAVLLQGSPPGKAWSAVEDRKWSMRIEALSSSGCGEIVDAAAAWAFRQGLPGALQSRPYGRTGRFDIDDPPGYFYVAVNWDPRKLGTTPFFAGYMISFRVSLFSSRRLSARSLHKIERRFAVPDLLAEVEQIARSCGWFQI